MAPTVSTVSPTQGPTTGGTTVTITGAGLTGATAVRFGSTPAASYTVNSSTQITAVAPAHSAGSAPVTVVSPTGTSNSAPYTFITAVLPTITAVTPPNGPTSGGTTLTLTGTGLTGATAVSFNGTPASSFTVNSATLITAVTPSGSAGAAEVTVTTPSGQSAASPGAYFFYAAPPVLHSATPSSSPTAGGPTVTLTGSNLLNASAVLFGPTNAVTYTVVSDTQINATVPGGTGAAQITVVTPGGTSNPLPFAYVAPPTLTAVVPANGPTSWGTVVTLTGTGFSTASAVRFAMSAVAFTVVSDTRITATVPGGAAGAVTVTVTTQGGTSTGLTYTRVAEPTI
ncbi:IPT/TIG domain-containing protein [Streptomyces sp. NPDC087903]|uniref:IPT/TIG domain-containing protein n=1 Tax=Streptomyces sp. NPDC087903 TaxID=3365819 RepID=UPI0037F2A0C9